jgi:hypothetical protein
MSKQPGWIYRRKYQYRAAVQKRRVEALVETLVDAMVARELKKLDVTSASNPHAQVKSASVRRAFREGV